MRIFGLSKVFRRRKRSTSRNKILVLLDLENILLNTNAGPFEFSLVDGFTKIIRKLGEFGRVVEVFVFGPPSTISINLDSLYQMEFRAIACPRVVVEKTGPKTDTVDSVMIDLGKKMITEMGELTHLCIGSGDRDFLPLVRETERSGLKVIIVAGNEGSLSEELARFACRNPISGERAVYFFSPKEIALEQ